MQPGRPAEVQDSQEKATVEASIKLAAVTLSASVPASGKSGTATGAAVSTARKPRLLVLVGLPCCGKSTVAAKLRQEGWVPVCQDVLGDRRACEQAAARALQKRRDVVIDRCNFDVQQRAHWLQLGDQLCGGRQGYVAMTLWLAVDPAVCQRRVVNRSDHPTLNGLRGQGVIARFANDFVAPQSWEGFLRRFVSRSSGDLAEILALLHANSGAADGGMLSDAGALAAQDHLLDSGADPCYRSRSVAADAGAAGGSWHKDVGRNLSSGGRQHLPGGRQPGPSGWRPAPPAWLQSDSRQTRASSRSWSNDRAVAGRPPVNSSPAALFGTQQMHPRHWQPPKQESRLPPRPYLPPGC